MKYTFVDKYYIDGIINQNGRHND